jgi:MoaA/NifB/PqqE/SkfB family radical SAM enzyme
LPENGSYSNPMQVFKKETHTLLEPTESNFEAFIKALRNDSFEKEHLVVNLLRSFNLSSDNLDVLSKMAVAKKEQGTSFVLVSETIEIDTLEDEMLSIVPTLIEAQDILDMDAMERDLGL